MNSIFAFLSELNEQGIKVRIVDDQLGINAPQALLTPELTAELKARKAEILTFLRQNQTVDTALVIQPVPRNEPLPLSFSQQRLWFLEQLGSGATYTIPAAFKVAGPLNVPALTQTLTEIVRRHESLRTTFSQMAGETWQLIHTPPSVEVPIIDLQQLSEAEQTAEVQRLARQETLRPFDLSSDLMLRATLLHLCDVNRSVHHSSAGNGNGLAATAHATRNTQHATENYVLLLTLHHIAADGWSLGLLVRELTTLYSAFAQGRPSPLPELSIQYADFAAWQRNRLQGELLAEQLTYWKTQLAGAPELLQLPTDFSRPPVQTFVANKFDFPIDMERTQQLRQLGQRSGTTLFMTLLAAFQVLLARYSGQDDILAHSLRCPGHANRWGQRWFRGGNAYPPRCGCPFLARNPRRSTGLRQ